ncbi:MAG: glycyl-radical enzyme activating protein [Bacteroidetes bacterium]|nr:glycyl-radical enzyme activating protein [Bacteroidota bacterium]
MARTELIKGILFDIQGFSVHDGPGCRTLVFLKGCSLQCAWCSNPEGISPYPEPLWNARKCTYDMACVTACPSDAINPDADLLIFDKTKCGVCSSFECINACCSGALRLAGYQLSVDEIFMQITRDRQYWGPDGGVTLTGGEPFLQPKFTFDLLKRCYDSYIHTAVETCGNVAWQNISPALPFLDWIFFDLKHSDPEKHQKMTDPGYKSGCHKIQSKNSPILQFSNPSITNSSNPSIVFNSHQRILANARHLASEFKGRLIFRMPVIPGFNDDAENIAATARFILETGRNEINILPVHHLGREKYNLLGETYYTTEFSIPTKDNLYKIRDQFINSGIECYIGSDTPF